MKKLLIAAFALISTITWAQTFEGTIKWSMKMEVTDPEMKAKMEAGQKKMNDPAQQEKMKKMQEQMNDPKMKAMMEANPALKAQMDKITKMSQGGGDMMSNMMPKGMTVKIKGTSSLMTMDGGMLSGDILHTTDKTVHLDRENKTYSVMPSGNGNENFDGAKPTVTKTGETTKILGYTCTKYVVTTVERGKTITTNLWATTEIKDIDLKAMAKQRMGRGQSMFYEGIDGMPLRIESSTPEGKMTMEVTDIKRQSFSASDFTIPSDYTETQGVFGGPR